MKKEKKGERMKILQKYHPDKIEKLEDSLINFIAGKDLEILKTEFPDNKWKFLSKKSSISI